MKTQREICAETDIPKATFIYWRREGLIPKPSGIKMREATWSDDVLDRVRFIKEQRASGASIAEVKNKLEINQLIEEHKSLNQEVKHLQKWGKPEDCKPEICKLLGLVTCGKPVSLPGYIDNERVYFVVVASGDNVHLAKIRATNGRHEELIDSIVLTIEEYAEVVNVICLDQARQGIIFSASDLAFYAFMLQSGFNDALEHAKARISLLNFGRKMAEKFTGLDK